MDSLWRIELLGALRAVQPGRVVSRFKTRKTGSLLGYLAFHLGRPIAREVLIELFWPGCAPDHGRQSLSQALSSLRHQLEPPGCPHGIVLSADRESIRCDPAAVVTDLHEFERSLRDAGGQRSGAGRRLLLRQALSLYRGELLPGFYDDWVLRERERVAATFARAALDLLHDDELDGDDSTALEAGRLLIQHDPLNDEGHRAVIRLLARTDQAAEAWAHYERWSATLRRELQMEPDAETTRLARAARARIAGAPDRSEQGASRASPADRGTRRQGAVGGSRSRAVGTAGRVEIAPAARPRGGTVTFLACEREAEEPPESTARADARTQRSRLRAVLPPSRRTEIERAGGWIVESGRGHFLAAFPGAGDAASLGAAILQEDLGRKRAVPAADDAGPLRLALHSGDLKSPAVRAEDPVPVRTHRLLLAARPGQLLCTQATAELLKRDAAPGFSLEDLGPHYLFEESAAERVHQLRLPEQEARAMLPLRARRAAAGNLPPSFTRFIGRESELERLAARVGQARDRLTTLTGPGGTGKTRLAVELGSRLAPSFPGGVWFVPLADVTFVDRLPEAILGALRSRRDPAQPPARQIASILGSERTLLVLDNCEHLLPDGGEIVRELLGGCPALQCLATSRRLLELEGEREFEVQPLPTPEDARDPEELLRSDSVRLFLDRAQAVRPDFQITRGNAEAVGRLCAALEGIPLAIELAAARVQVLTPRQMTERLGHRLDLLVSRRRDVAARHRTLRDAIHWSDRLLPPELRRFFAHLSIFDGSWTAEAAEEVCEEPLALDALSQLRECSLVESFEAAGEMRFRMLDTIREYAREQTTDDEERALAERFGEYYLRLAERIEPRLRSRERLIWLDRLTCETENLERALRGWAASAELPLQRKSEPPGSVDGFLRLVVALSPFWQLRGHLRDGRGWLDRALAASGEDPGEAAREGNEVGGGASDVGAAVDRTPLRARALDEAACLAFLQGDLAAAGPLLARSLEAFRACGDAAGEATVLMDLGNLALVRGDFAGARTHYERALAIRKERGDRQGVARCLHNFGNLAKVEGDLDAARSHLEKSLRMKQEFDDPWDTASTRQSLGDVAANRDDADSARVHYEACLAIRRGLGDRQGVAFVLGNLAMLLGSQGEEDAAEAMHRESLALKRDLGDRRGISGSILNLGALALRRGDAARAARLFAAASAIHGSIGFRLPPKEQERYEARLAEIRAALSPQTFDAALATGRLMSESEAIAYAMAG